MAYRRFGRRSYGYHPGLHGQLLHRPSRRGTIAKIAARRAYRKSVRMPKRLLAKTYSQAVGQIAYKEGKLRPSHGRYGFKRKRFGLRRFGYRRKFRRF